VLTDLGSPNMLPVAADPVAAVAWSGDGKRIAAGTAAGDVVLFDTAGRAKELRRWHVGGRGGTSTVHALAFAPDGKSLAAAVQYDEGRNVNRVVRFDLATGERRQDLQGFNEAPVVAVAFGPGGRTLLAACGRHEPHYRSVPRNERREKGEVQVWALAAAGGR
ncbi:MAG: hypothetical protein K2P78_07235, partial [Gemmataceae bacterium]|nr:hypothetical protein [Gemmataceae bacterium]